MQTIKGPPDRGNPQEPISLAAEVQGGSDEIGRLPTRLDRYANGRARALQNLTHIQTLTLQPGHPLIGVKHRLSHCGSYLVFRNYYTEDKVLLTHANFCKAHLLCPLCAIRRGAKQLRAYYTKYLAIIEKNPHLRFSHVVMTVKNGPDLIERHDHLKSALKVLRKARTRASTGSRHKTEWSKIVALVGSYEVTNKGNGWHPHVHMCVLHDSLFDYSKLREEWLRITGDSVNFRIDAARHPEDPVRDFLEVFKYAIKFSDLSPELNLEAYLALRTKNLLFSIGAFRGIEVPDHLTDDITFEDIPYIEMFYRFSDLHYNLVKTREITTQDPDPTFKNLPEEYAHEMPY